MKKEIILSAALLAVSGFAEAKEPMIGMPNPMVEYQSYQEMSEILDFNPLYLPQITGYRSYYMAAISRNIGDIRYKNDKGSELTIRTAEISDVGTHDISGIHGANWKKLQIGDTSIFFAALSKDSWAARWKEGDYVFSATGENMEQGEFLRLLSDSLVDMTEHLYKDD